MFANIHELRDMLSLMIDVIDERNELLEENIQLREQLKEERENTMEIYRKNISTTADILNTMVSKLDEQ